MSDCKHNWKVKEGAIYRLIAGQFEFMPIEQAEAMLNEHPILLAAFQEMNKVALDYARKLAKARKIALLEGGEVMIEGNSWPDENVEITPTLRFNSKKGGYEIISGNTWCGVPIMKRETVRAMLDDMEAHVERRNPFDRHDALLEGGE